MEQGPAPPAGPVCAVTGKGRALHGAQWTKVRERRVDNENPMTLMINMTPPQFGWASSAFQDLPGPGFPSRTLGCHLKCPKFRLTSGQFWQEERTSSCYWHVVDPKPYLVLPSLCLVLCTREPSPFCKRWALSVNLMPWTQEVLQSVSNKPIVNFHWIRILTALSLSDQYKLKVHPGWSGKVRKSSSPQNTSPLSSWCVTTTFLQNALEFSSDWLCIKMVMSLISNSGT